MVLRPYGPLPLSGRGLLVRRGLHDSGASRARVGGARRPEPPLARAEGEGGRAEPADRRLRDVVRHERVVLRMGGRWPSRTRREALTPRNRRWTFTGVSPSWTPVPTSRLELLRVHGANSRRDRGRVAVEARRRHDARDRVALRPSRARD